MSKINKAIDAAVFNLASLTILSAKDRKLTIELKGQAPIGILESGVDADKLLDDISRSFGMDSNLDKGIPIPHINGVPIPTALFPDVMRVIGEIYYLGSCIEHVSSLEK